MPVSQLEAALSYAQMAWRVFPCIPGPSKGPNGERLPGKRPYTPNGFKDATTDEPQIRSWWRRWPDAVIGVALDGRLFVLDADDLESFDRLIADKGQLPLTVEARTARSGFGSGSHFYFESPDRTIKNRDLKAQGYEGVETRGLGGYVIAPSDGDPGRDWVRSPWDHEFSPAPAWLLELLTRDAPRATGSREPAVGGKTREGGRNTELASLAGSMRRTGFCESAILAALQAENAERCSPPLDASEVEQIAHSVARYAPSADVHASFDQLTALLALDTVGRRIVGVASYGPRGGRADVYLRLDDASQIALCPLSNYSTAAKLAFEIASQTMARIRSKDLDVLQVVALIRALSHHTESVELAGRALDLGSQYLADAAVAEFTNDQAGKFRAFSDLDQRNEFVRAGQSHVVLLDSESGTRYVRSDWLRAYVSRHADVGETSRVIRELERAGWSQSGTEGRIKATSPQTGRTIVRSFWRVPKGWEDR